MSPRTALKPLLDLALPPRCPGCGAPVEADARLCGECWASLSFITDPMCTRCGRPFEAVRPEGMTCAPCLQSPPRHDGMRAAVIYDDLSRDLALKLKYGRRIALAALLAHFMARHLPDDREGWLLVPVPLHRWRLWRRGFNQAALIAAALARRGDLAVCPDALVRTKATPPLKGKSARERARLLGGAIAAHPGRTALLKGARVILIDDVHTSGATVTACVRALRRAGASEVRILCWARVLREGEEGAAGHADPLAA